MAIKINLVQGEGYLKDNALDGYAKMSDLNGFAKNSIICLNHNVRPDINYGGYFFIESPTDRNLVMEKDEENDNYKNYYEVYYSEEWPTDNNLGKLIGHIVCYPSELPANNTTLNAAYEVAIRLTKSPYIYCKEDDEELKVGDLVFELKQNKTEILGSQVVTKIYKVAKECIGENSWNLLGKLRDPKLVSGKKRSVNGKTIRFIEKKGPTDLNVNYDSLKGYWVNLDYIDSILDKIPTNGIVIEKKIDFSSFKLSNGGTPTSDNTMISQLARTSNKLSAFTKKFKLVTEDNPLANLKIKDFCGGTVTPSTEIPCIGDDVLLTITPNETSCVTKILAVEDCAILPQDKSLNCNQYTIDITGMNPKVEVTFGNLDDMNTDTEDGQMTDVEGKGYTTMSAVVGKGYTTMAAVEGKGYALNTAVTALDGRVTTLDGNLTNVSKKALGYPDEVLLDYNSLNYYNRYTTTHSVTLSIPTDTITIGTRNYTLSLYRLQYDNNCELLTPKKTTIDGPKTVIVHVGDIIYGALFSNTNITPTDGIQHISVNTGNGVSIPNKNIIVDGSTITIGNGIMFSPNNTPITINLVN